MDIALAKMVLLSAPRGAQRGASSAGRWETASAGVGVATTGIL